MGLRILESSTTADMKVSIPPSDPLIEIGESIEIKPHKQALSNVAAL